MGPKAVTRPRYCVRCQRQRQHCGYRLMVAAADLWNGKVAFAEGVSVRKRGLEQYAIAPRWRPLRSVRKAWLAFLYFERWREVDASFSEACVDAASFALVGQLVEWQQLLEALVLYGVT